MPGWSQNPFWADETDSEPIEVDTGATSHAPQAKTKAQQSKKKEAAKKRAASGASSGEHSKKKKTPTAQDLFGSDTDDDDLPSGQPAQKEAEESSGSQLKPTREARLQSFFSQRGSNGYTTQRDLIRVGEHYLELRVYNWAEVEREPSNERWKRALITLKLGTNRDTAVWRALQALVHAGREEFKAIQPIMYPKPW